MRLDVPCLRPAVFLLLAWLGGGGVVHAQTNSGPDNATLHPAAITLGGTTLAKPTGSSPNALRITGRAPGDTGVLDIQNTDNAGNSFSTINFLNLAGAYRFSIGYGNTSYPTFADSAFLEANSLVGANQVPPNLNIVQTGTKPDSSYDTNVRAQFVGNGNIVLYGRIAGTIFGPVALQVSPSGRVRLGTAGSGTSANLDYAGYGTAQVFEPPNTATAVSITQDGVATGYQGFAAGSNVYVIGSDGPALSFRSNPGGSLAGTERARLDLATGHFSAAGGVQVGSGGTPIARLRHGSTTLHGGTATVRDASVTADTRIFLTAQDGSTTGALRISARNPGDSFSIASAHAADEGGVVAYEMIEP